jgi:hypothetical protein
MLLTLYINHFQFLNTACPINVHIHDFSVYYNYTLKTILKQ